MSAGHYHRRWSANTAGRTTPTSQTLAGSIEPSTYGTSWNSVRWNKPSTTGYRSHASTIAARFEPKTYYSSVSPSPRTSTVPSRYSNGTTNEAARAAAQLTSLGPSVSARASRFDTSVRDGGSKYRNEARELLNKWTSRERNNADSSSTSKPMENAAANGYLNKTNEYPYRKTASVTPSRTTVPAISRFSADRTSALSASPLPQSHTPRAERPWRQRLAESSRIRASLGDDVSTSYTAARNARAWSRRSSQSQASGDELSQSVDRLRSYVSASGYRSRNGSTDSSTYGSRTRASTSYTPSFALSYSRTKADEPKEVMSRSYSPIRPRYETSYRSMTLSEQPRPSLRSSVADIKSDRNSSIESLRDADRQPTSHAGVSSVPKNPSIRESSQERDSERHRKRSSRERTARRNSRQRAQTQSSSSDEEIDRSLTRADAKQRRRRRHKESAERAPLPPPSLAANGMLKSLDSSHSKTGNADDTKSTTKEPRPPAPSVDLPVSAGPKPPRGPAFATPMIVVPVLMSPPMSPTPTVIEQSVPSVTVLERLSVPQGRVTASLSAPPGGIACSPSPPPPGAIGDQSRNVRKSLSPPRIHGLNAITTSSSCVQVPGYVSTSEDLSTATKSDTTLKGSRANSMADPPVKNTEAPVVASPPPPPPKSGTDASSIIDDESQYSAVVHFKPNKLKVKRVAPVPGLWKVEGADEFISKNKRLVREPEQEAILYVWKVRPREFAIKRIKMPKTTVVKKPEPEKPLVTVPVTDEDQKKEVKVNSQIAGEKRPKKKIGPSMLKELFSGITKDEKVEEKVVVEEEKKPVRKFEAPVVKIEKKTPPPQRKVAKAAVVEPSKEKVEQAKAAVVEPSKEKVEQTKAAVVEPSKEKVEQKSAVPEPKKDVELKGMKVSAKPAVPKEEKIQISAVLRSKTAACKGEVTVILVQPVFVVYKHPQKIREKKPLVTKSVSYSLVKKPLQLDGQKTVVQKKKSSASVKLSCKATSIKHATCIKEFNRKAAQFGAQVTVDVPVLDVNLSRVRLSIRRPKKTLPPPPVETETTPRRSTSVESELAHLQAVRRAVEASPMSTSTSRAAEVLDDMRNSEPAHVFRRPSREEEYNASGHLILPDKSLLEEYVRRKRGRLEQLLKEPIAERGEPRCDSPANSVTSELIPACAVRVFERSPYGVPVITAPSRSTSRVSSVGSVEPNTPTVMLDTITSYNNFNSTPQGFLREARIQIAKPISFDPPRTPFEERLQQQAHAIRKASASSILSADERSPDNRPSPRRFSNPPDGMSALTTSFTNAIAANANNARHERYAAHIPVNKGDSGSGRQSTISQDSQQSGALENATKQLDHVIDQARHKHSQHRNKFKEAIDYLDQIFEDLKKECDTGGEDAMDRTPRSAGTSTTTTTPRTVNSDSIRRPTVLHPTPSKPSTSTPKRAVRPVKPVQPPSPVEVVLPKPPVAPDSETAEVDVAETIVLPKKTDKLDFTRRWLHDDLSSLAFQPPAPVMFFPEPCSFYNDPDEHSLGSCSAEVAAINAPARREKSKRSNGIAIVASLEKPAPIRPQPCRPQPVYGSQGRTSGPRNFPMELEVPSIPRVASYDHVPERRDYPSNTWRSGSQEPHQAHGSVPPEDVLRPSPSAFQTVSNLSGRSANMRGSLRSLPDAGLIIRGRYQHQPSPMKDPSLAIDQLCAELELNTEQPMTAADKRRSFPTSYARDSAFATGSSVYEQPMRRLSEKRAPPIERKAQPYQQPPVGLYHAAAVSSHQPVHQSHSTPMNNQHRVTHAAAQHPPQQPQPAAQVQRVPQPPQFATQPVVKKSNPQRQQKSLDEVTNMLNNVVNDFHATQQPPRKKSQPSHALYATPHSMNQSNPFETINQEKINPSRVEAMHNMFERNAAPAQNRWSAQPPYQPHLIRPREDDAYHDINDYHSNRPHVMKAATATIPPPPSTAAPVPPPYIGPHASPPRHNAIGIRNSSPSYVTEFTPAYPTTQPPSHPPGRNGSATSSQNGGYYSSNSSGVGAPSYQHSQISARRGSIVGHQSASSRAASIADDDDDDGFYDNIGTYDDRRISRSSEMDIQSLSSHQLPPNNWKPTKIGSFFRKIGAGNRPPGSAASLVSLNKVANETPMKPGNLMKSNSLSTEPWKKMVIENPSIPAREPTPSKGGLGARLKNSIFGSKKRLNG
ncbi:hypothetical protein V3C99_003617 [Haemonchus contortus]